MTKYSINQIWTVLPVVLILLTGFSDQITIESDFGNQHDRSALANVFSQNITPVCNTNFESIFEFRDCTVKVKTDDMDIELTLHDVSWWDCTRLKLKALWEFGF